ncbi:3-hydroxyacyl-CoA dehydrogenase type-2 [Toxocara canis]|uniref:3-hydroxyacyl-CoA dehydrogenase type-2 n=1 Tax=Toxocara canis TaxID=6265 RepID=A0A0B2VWY1_TOXCA|nr:3-hydroxyacyl-CoA dehydrogenase type-2 [Toxocara canis]
MSSGTGMSALRSAKSLVTLVTGGASGLGRGTAEHLLKHGAKVAILDLPTSKAAELAKELGADCLFTSANVTAVAEVKAALGEVKKTFGRLDVVVNCAGIAYAFKLYSVKKKVMADLEQVRRTLDVNVMGSFNVIAHAVEMFAENEKDDLGQRGLIINTASIAAFDGQAGQSSYSASKGAIASMTLPLARDFADDGIRVMAIAPGIFDTPIMGSFPPKQCYEHSGMGVEKRERKTVDKRRGVDMKGEQVHEFLSGLVPHPRRFGMPEEFGALVRHIIENRYLNGEVIRLDGALRMPA